MFNKCVRVLECVCACVLIWKWLADNIKWNVYIFICFIWNAISMDVKQSERIHTQNVVHLKVDTFQCTDALARVHTSASDKTTNK